MRQPHDEDKPYKPQACDYQGTELLLNPGILPARMVAYSLPSRVGGRLYYPGGRVERFPSTEEAK